MVAIDGGVGILDRAPSMAGGAELGVALHGTEGLRSSDAVRTHGRCPREARCRSHSGARHTRMRSTTTRQETGFPAPVGDGRRARRLKRRAQEPHRVTLVDVDMRACDAALAPYRRGRIETHGLEIAARRGEVPQLRPAAG